MLSKLKFPLLIFLFSFAVLAFYHPVDVSAQTADYKLLAPLPLGPSGGEATQVNIETYIPAMVKLIIALAGGLAVLRIIFGGIQYMSTDAFDGKTEAKSTINGALIGLLLAISAYTILNTINPKLVELNLKIDPVGCRAGTPGCAIDGTIGVNDTKTADEVGCNNCEPIDAGEITVKQGACSNDPCYLEVILESLVGAVWIELRVTATSTYRAIQVIRAFPPVASSTDPACYKPGLLAGNCVDIGLTVQSTENIRSLLKTTQTVTRLSSYSYRYNACGNRQIELRNHSRLNDFDNNIFYCFTPLKGEYLQIYKPGGTNG